MIRDLIVVGGGAAGMMAAITAAERGLSVALFDKNERLGRKLRITGKGRCNLCNDCDAQELAAAVPRGGKFLYSAFSAFGPRDVMSFFEGLGVPLKTERGRRVFPASDRAEDVAEALVRRLRALGVRVFRARVERVLTEEGRAAGVLAGGKEYPARAVLLCCGGASYPGTGSDGGGWRLAEALGHHVTELAPALVPLTERGDFCRRVQGLSLRNCGITVTEAGKKKPVYEDFGELLFTHFGLSGPVILSASCHLLPMAPGKYTVHIDLKPALSGEKLDARLLRELGEQKNREFGHSLNGLLPRKLIPAIVGRSGIPSETRCHSVTRAQRQAFAALLKDLTVEIEGFRPLAEAIVTAGGIKLKEVDPRSMESRLVPGLYFAGEMLDCSAYTGGYNLQIAWSTGRLAGSAVKGGK